MSDSDQIATTKDVVASIIATLIESASEEIANMKIHNNAEMHKAATSDVLVMDSVTEQMTNQIQGYKRELEKVIKQKGDMIDKVVEFRRRLKKRHEHIADDVLKRYEDFFELKDA